MFLLQLCRPVYQVIVQQRHRRHRLHDGHGAGQHAGVVSSAGFEGGVLAVDVHRVLLHQDGGDGLEGDAEVDVLSVADAALVGKKLFAFSKMDVMTGSELLSKL